MGVTGLLTFIFDNRKKLLKTIELRDTKLIIDGHGICRILSKYLNPKSDYFGGNYDEFAKLCEDFFTDLSDCNIEPYVFFDGLQDEERAEVTLRRLKERFGWQLQISAGKPLDTNSRLSSVLSYETFESVLVKRGIPHETCTWESDPEIVLYAQKEDYPVLTCDSDFLIYD